VLGILAGVAMMFFGVALAGLQGIR
jgi:hypothetical protein